MTKPKVSVVVTSYNDEEFVEKCLRNIVEQTLEDIEIICIDDVSQDSTVKIVKELAKKDKRIRVIVNEENQGVSASRNRGIMEARADYVMFCDADDYYETTTCEELWRAIESNKADLAVAEVNVIYYAHREMKASDDNYYTLKYYGKQVLTDDVIYNTDLAPTNKIFRKTVIENNNISFPEGHRYEDAYFCVAYMCCSRDAYYLNKRLYNYVRRENSFMSTTWSKGQADVAIEHLTIAFLLFDFLEKKELLGRYNQLFWRFFEAFEAFAINYSKSKNRVREAKAKARQFISGHQEYFDAAGAQERENIRRLSNRKLHIDTVRLKRLVVKFFPTYKLAAENVNQIQNLKKKQQEVIEQIDKLTDM